MCLGECSETFLLGIHKKIKLNARILNILEEEKVTLIFCLVQPECAAGLELGSCRSPGLA